MTTDTIERYGELIPRIPFRAVAIHPVADDTAWLVANDMRPEDCMHVDLYWEGDGFLAFVAIEGGAGEAFVTHTTREDTDIPHSFFVSLPDTPITTQVVTKTLSWLTEWAAHHPDQLLEPGTGAPKRIARFDITKPVS